MKIRYLAILVVVTYIVFRVNIVYAF